MATPGAAPALGGAGDVDLSAIRGGGRRRRSRSRSSSRGRGVLMAGRHRRYRGRGRTGGEESDVSASDSGSDSDSCSCSSSGSELSGGRRRRRARGGWNWKSGYKRPQGAVYRVHRKKHGSDTAYDDPFFRKNKRKGESYEHAEARQTDYQADMLAMEYEKKALYDAFKKTPTMLDWSYPRLQKALRTSLGKVAVEKVKHHYRAKHRH